jgi:hypothetical protein
MTARRALLLVIAALAAACAHEPAVGSAADDRRQVEEAAQALRQGEVELLSARAGAAPDCVQACVLADNICALADRICGIAARHPPGDPLTARCADARARCLRARDTVASACTCSLPP